MYSTAALSMDHNNLHSEHLTNGNMRHKTGHHHHQTRTLHKLHPTELQASTIAKKKKISHIYFPACSVHADSDTAKHIQHGNVYMYTTPATASRTLTRKARHISTPTSPSQSHPPHDSVETHTHTHTRVGPMVL